MQMLHGPIVHGNVGNANFKAVNRTTLQLQHPVTHIAVAVREATKHC